MAKVTSKLQLTLPKALAEQYKIRPGDELDFRPAGGAIRVTKRSGLETTGPAVIEQRLALFDQATTRQQRRERESSVRNASASRPKERGWTRDELYHRGFSR